MKFKFYDKSDISPLISIREGESKLGEHISCNNKLYSNLVEFKGKFVLMGVPEDIGPRANQGRPGAGSAWEAFLVKFLNIQQNEYLLGENILLLGHLEVPPVESNEIQVLRKSVEEIDQALIEVLIPLFKADKIPILIGGGHNNAYPLLKAYQLAKGSALNVVNMDPHADYRPLEGRHSGNPFSYAQTEGFLNHYFLMAFHESYNALNHLKEFDKGPNKRISYESIFIRNERNYAEVLKEYQLQISKQAYGIELDCDSIAHFPSSAQSPSGINENQARQYLNCMGNHANASYLHLPEAAPALVEHSTDQVGKLLSYLVSDFCKAKSKS